MRALARFLATACVLFAAGAAVWYVALRRDRDSPEQSTQDAYVRGDITALAPRVAGYVVELLADDNSVVAAKQVLARIDPRDYRAALDRAGAATTQAAAALLQATARLILQQAQIEVAAAALQSAEAQAGNADIILGRARELLSRGAGTQATFDTASAAGVSARSGVSQARAQLSYQRQQLAVLEADVTVAKAQQSSAEAAERTSRLQLEDTQGWAPIAGTVANRRAEVGAYATLGMTLLSIVPSDGLWIEAQFRETQLARMRPDQPVAITLDQYGGRQLCGYVEAIGAAAASEFSLVPPDNATGNFTKIVRRFPVRIRPNAGEAGAALLRPGQSAAVTVAVAGDAVGGCRFDRTRDRRPPSLHRLPDHPGLQADAAQ